MLVSRNWPQFAITSVIDKAGLLAKSRAWLQKAWQSLRKQKKHQFALVLTLCFVAIVYWLNSQ